MYDSRHEGKISILLKFSCHLIILLIYLNPAFISAVLAQEDFDTDEILIHYYVDKSEITSLSEIQCLGDDNESYELATIPKLDYRIVPGVPIIPFKTARILVPMGAEVEDIEVIPGEQEYIGKFLIAPGQNVSPICCNNTSESEFFTPNEAIYEFVEPYPNDVYSVVGIQKKCGYNILYLNLYPIKYMPSTGDAYYISNFDIRVKTSDLEKLDRGLFRGSPLDREIVSQMVDNPDTITTYVKDFELTGRSPLLNGEYDYVIITSEMLKNAPEPNFQTLATWKNSRNVKTAIVTVEDIYETYKYTLHEDNQEMIRNFIRDVYLNNNVTYILLGGDGDVARIGGETWPDNTVPSKSLCCCWKYKESPPSIVSDHYYAALDGNFNANGNQVYGEAEDKPDLLTEVYVGRAPADSAGELNNFVRKTISYESTDPRDPYLKGALMVGEYIGWPFEGEITVWGGNHKDSTKRLFPSTFNIMRLYDRDYIGTDCSIDYHNWPKSELINRINRGGIHLINHVGTTNFCDVVSVVMKMSYADVDALKNDEYFLGYSAGSWAGSFDNKNPEGIYLPNDCVLEHFVTAPCGAFAFIGFSGYSWAAHNNVDDGPVNTFDEAFWYAIFKENILNIGRANQQSKEVNIGRIDESDYGKSARRCYYGINLLGDPETPFILPSTTTEWDTLNDHLDVDMSRSEIEWDDRFHSRSSRSTSASCTSCTSSTLTTTLRTRSRSSFETR